MVAVPLQAAIPSRSFLLSVLAQPLGLLTVFVSMCYDCRFTRSSQALCTALRSSKATSALEKPSSSSGMKVNCSAARLVQERKIGLTNVPVTLPVEERLLLTTSPQLGLT
ncbi:hypothetical protein EV361DRAFT_879395 [Lentinula raphanica]|nr:hypothetical protein EV361DRAFT_879395 [Lentinula raphanica]